MTSRALPLLAAEGGMTSVRAAAGWGWGRISPAAWVECLIGSEVNLCGKGGWLQAIE